MKKIFIILAFLLPLSGFSQNILPISGGKIVKFQGGITIIPENIFEFDDIDYYNAERAPNYLPLIARDSTRAINSDSSVTHPDIIYIRPSWNGYKYWLTHTPLPEAAPDRNENPHILASNDLLTWVEPAGISNPIKLQPVTSYNSDPDLFYESGYLYCLYRTWTNLPGPGNRGVIEIKRSSDGITWNDSTEIIDFTAPGIAAITSPSLLKDNGYYYIYTVETSDVSNAFIYRYRSSSLLSGWAIYDTVSVDFSNCFLPDQGAAPTYNFRMWHMNVDKVGSDYVLTIYTRTDNYVQLWGAQNIWLAKGSDGINFEAAKYPIFLKDYDDTPNNPAGNIAWDMGFYRAALLSVEDTMHIFYAGWNGEFENYPTKIGKTKIQEHTPNITFDKPYNTISDTRISQLATANTLSGGYTFADDLNRVDNENVNPSSSGVNWNLRIGDVDISDSMLIKDSGASTTAIDVIADSTDYEVEMNLEFNQVTSTSDASDFRIYLKATAYNGNYVGIVSGINNTLLLRASSSVITVLERKVRNYINLNDLNCLKYRVVGNNFKVWINGVMYFDHDLEVSEFGGNQTNYDNLLNSKTTVFFWNTTFDGMKIKNITVKNL